jgi:hypothetical protein
MDLRCCCLRYGVTFHISVSGAGAVWMSALLPQERR